MNEMLTPLADGSVPASKPQNEAERIEQLRHFCILDTTKDSRFDRITRLVAELLDVPIVLLSLVDEAREWFKSAIGTDISQINRELGFCAHAILVDSQEPMVVADTLLDPRFATHPYVVAGPKLRFYAGAPLITATGHKLGMLCLHDIKPRPDFGAHEKRILSQFAAIAMDEIDFHRIESERQLLVGELSHRVKNVFSVVHSVAAMSSRGDRAAETFVEVFNSRLGAMSAAHDQLIRSDWNEASLDRLVRSVVAASQDAAGSTISIAMPPVMINPAFAQTLALLVHELLTNALKYGALKVPSGHVSFTAAQTNSDGRQGIAFCWRETGGAPPVAPVMTGFGHRMLDMAVRQRGGTVHYDWQTAGLVCQFEIFDMAL